MDIDHDESLNHMLPISSDLLYYSHWKLLAYKYEYIMQQQDIIRHNVGLQSNISLIEKWVANGNTWYKCMNMSALKNA